MSKVLLLHIDGCRADLLGKANTPAIDKLMEEGAWTMEASTVSPSVTLPVHCAIFTSMTPLNHGVLTNVARPTISPSAMGMIEWVKSHGKTTAMYYNWEFLRELSPPGYLTRSIFVDTSFDLDGDMQVATTAAADIIHATPDLAFVYLGCLDETGHSFGFDSEEYMISLANADKAIAHLLDRLEESDLLKEYTILFQSDHGGIDHEHTEDVPEVMTVPWVLKGPKVKPGKLSPLTSIKSRANVSVLDTAPTLMHCMGLPSHHMWQGHLVAEAFI